MATKERRKTPPRAPKYHRLTDEKCIIIEALRKEGCSKKHISERVGCHLTTVWRELKRNVSKKGCRHKKAQGKANHRVAERRNLRLKPALQSQTKTAIIPTTSKKASSAQGSATSVALATGWRETNPKYTIFENVSGFKRMLEAA